MNRFSYTFFIVGIMLFLSTLFLQESYAALQTSLLFTHLSDEHGLAHSRISSIIQDQRGFLWFGTANGLHRYDGYEMKDYRHDPDNLTSLSENLIRVVYEDRSGTLWVGTWQGGLHRFNRDTDTFTRYQHDPQDPASLSNNQVFCLYEDQAGNFWVGTVGGLNRFDRETETFVHYQHDPNRSDSLSDNEIYALAGASDGGLWVGTWKGGLNYFDPQTEQFTHYQHDPTTSQSLSHKQVVAVHEDHTGIVWIATWGGGLNAFEPQSGRWTHYRLHPDDPDSIGSDQIFSLYEDHSGALWIGTSGGGLNRFNRETGTFTRYRHDPADPQSISSDRVRPIYEDREGIFWIGAWGSGISRFYPDRKPFINYHHNPNNPQSLIHDTVQSLYEDRSGDLWIGTLEGLDRLDRETNTFIHFRHNPDNPHSIPSNIIYCVYQDSQATLWIGAAEGGLIRFDQKTQQFIQYRHDRGDSASISGNMVYTIYEDQTGMLWIGTNRQGLNRFDRRTEQFTRFQHDQRNPESIGHNSIFSITEDLTGTLWIGTGGGGLNRYDRASETFVRYQRVAGDSHSLSDNVVYTVYADQTGTLWIGTANGLNCFNPETEQFTRYLQQEGLPGTSIYGILEDKQGDLWLSTNHGISHFDPVSGQFRNYDRLDGIQGNEFNIGAFHKNQQGDMFFGGTSGFTVFSPNQITDNPIPPPVVFTEFQINNHPVSIGDEAPLSKTITETEALTLSYRDRVLSFRFAALSYVAPLKNRYKYQLKGFDPEWIQTSAEERVVTYTNLDPGDYELQVRGSNNDRIWNTEGASIKITVTPPWWETWWFYTLCILGVLGIFGAVYWNKARQLHIERELTQALQRSETHLSTSLKEKEVLLRELYHRTKNTMQVIGSMLIIQASKHPNNAPVQKLVRETENKIQAMSLVHHKLYQSQDLSRIDAREYIAELTQLIMKSYGVSEDAIALNLEIEPLKILLDTAIPCGLILNELLANAIKYAFPEGKGGEISISLFRNEAGLLELSVADTGIGVPEEFNFRSQETLGLQTIFAVAEHQLQGTVIFAGQQGLKCTIIFPDNLYTERV